MQDCSETGEHASAPLSVTVPLDSPGAQENAAIALGLPANWLPILAEKEAQITRLRERVAELEAAVEITRLRRDLAERDATIDRLTAELDDARNVPVEYAPTSAVEAAMTADPDRIDGTVLREAGGQRRAWAWKAAAREWEQIA
jgi:hypothetical protein